MNKNFQLGDRVVTPCGYRGTVAYVYVSYVGVDFDAGAPISVHNGNCFKHDGTQNYPAPGKAASISKVAATGKLDVTKPLEAVNLKTGEVVPVTYRKPYGVSGFFTTEAPCSATSNSVWYNDGTDYCNRKEWIVRNVAAVPALDLTKPLQRRAGAPVKLIGRSSKGELVVEVSPKGYSSYVTTVPANGLLYGASATLGSSSDIINVPVKLAQLVTYRNVYADGTMGGTEYTDRARAVPATKYDKVRVGLLVRTYEFPAGTSALSQKSSQFFKSATVEPTAPQLRTRSNPKGTNPWA